MVCLAPEHRKALHRGRKACADVRGRHGDGAELQIVPHAQLGKYISPLRDVAQAEFQQPARRRIGNVAAFEPGAAGLRLEQAEHGLEHGRFAGPVGADDGRDGSAPHPERGAVQDRHRAVTGDEAVDLENWRIDGLNVQDRPLSPPDCCGLGPASPPR